MIVFELEGAKGFVKQREHARLSRKLGDELWDSMPSIVRTAIRHHDDGWKEYDRFPRLGKDNPIDYRSVPLGDHLKILTQSVDRCEKLGPYAGWLVSRHGCSFHKNKTGKIVRDFLNKEKTRRQDLVEKITHETFVNRERDFHWLQFTDALSLYLLDPWSPTLTWDREQPGKVIVRKRDRGHYEWSFPDELTSPLSPLEFSFLYRRLPNSDLESAESIQKTYPKVQEEKGTLLLEPA